MMRLQSYLVGSFAAVATFSVMFWTLIYFSKNISVSRLKARRKHLISSYFVINAPQKIQPPPIQISTAVKLFENYGNRIIKDEYRNRLQTLITHSGVIGSDGFTSLVRRKLAFSLVGFGVGFLLLLFKTSSAIPLVLAFLVFGYFLPNLEEIGKRFLWREYRAKPESLLSSADERELNHSFKLINRKLLFSFFALVISYFYLLTRSQSFSVLPLSIFLISLGFFMPDILLQNIVLKRKELIARSLPDAIDMLLMCVSAGLAFPAALNKVAETQSGPIAEEFSRVTKEVQLGQSRTDALNAMAQRTNEIHVQRFVNAMVQVDRFGISVSNVLEEQSMEMRIARRESAREQGQKVPLKILAPIMLCFLPCVLIIIVGPAILGIISTFGV